jgi:hypothetical protein
MGGGHEPLFRDLKASLQCQPIVWNENSDLWGQRGTANYRVMFAGAQYLQSIRFGNAAQRTKARNRVIELLRVQEELFGHMTIAPKANEQFVLDPHTNFWIPSMVAFTVGAWETNDEEIKSRMTRWWSTHFYYLKISWTGTETRIPGTRLKGNLPSWSVDSDIYKIVSGIPFKLGNVWIAPHYFKKMLESFPYSVPNIFRPGKLLMPLHFEQTASGFLAWMEKPETLPLTPVDWILSREAPKGQFTYGKNWESPRPH